MGCWCQTNAEIGDEVLEKWEGCFFLRWKLDLLDLPGWVPERVRVPSPWSPLNTQVGPLPHLTEEVLCGQWCQRWWHPEGSGLTKVHPSVLGGKLGSCCPLRLVGSTCVLVHWAGNIFHTVPLYSAWSPKCPRQWPKFSQDHSANGWCPCSPGGSCSPAELPPEPTENPRV